MTLLLKWLSVSMSGSVPYGGITIYSGKGSKTTERSLRGYVANGCQ